MKILDGRELADFVKERQARQVRGLRQASNIFPKLVILKTTDDPVISTYVRLKQQYGEDILIDVEVRQEESATIIDTIKALNDDQTIHGIVVQLPLADPLHTDEVVNAIDPAKDVDGLGAQATYPSATAMAINWLLAGYNIELRNKVIGIVGQGRLVGAPLAKMWQQASYDVRTFDDTTQNLAAEIKQCQVVVSATGQPGLITSQMLQPGSIVVDAGTAMDNGQIVGDVAPSVRDREDLTMTPEKGGVGPLTVAALFDNVIQAASAASN